MAHVNLFAGKDTKGGWGGIGKLPAVQIKLNSILTSFGVMAIVDNVRANSTTDDEYFIFEVPTLVVNPIVNDNVDSARFGDGSMAEIHPKYYGGYSCYRISKKVCEDQINIKFKFASGNEVFVGSYLPSRNALCAYFNFFRHNPPDEDGDCVALKLAEWFVKCAKDSGVKLRKHDTTKVLEELSIRKLVSAGRKSLMVAQQELDETRQQIVNYSSEIVRSTRKIHELTAQVERASKMLSQDSKAILAEVKAVKSLPFVKSVKLSVAGLEVEIGKTSVSHGGREVYLGDVSLVIKSDHVLVKNKNLLHITSRPHFNCNPEGQLCLGTASNDFTAALASFDYRKLVFLIYGLLKTYNQNDHAVSFETWEEERKREGLFDSKGNLLIKEEKKEVIEVATTSTASSD